MNKLKFISGVALLLLPLTSSAVQVNGNKGMSFQAVVRSPGGALVNSASTAVNVKILSPSGCILWEEDHAGINITDGYLNLGIGQGTKGGDTPSGMTFKKVFDNSQSYSPIVCVDAAGVVSGVTSYAAASTDPRIARITFDVGADNVIVDFTMRSSSFAMNSESLNGKSDSDFIQVSASVTQSILDTLVGKLSGSNLQADSATTATTAGNVSGTVAIANGGTGATTASAARTALGLGTLSVLSPSGTASASTYLRGDGSWTTISSSGITSLNSQSDTSQSFAIGTTGTAPAFSSASGVHTLNVPMASAAGVTAGLISKTDYDAFSGKQASGSYLTALSGDISTSGFSAGSATATIAAAAIDSAKIADGAVVNSKIVSMEVDKISSAAGKYFTYKPNNVVCTDQQVLKWSTANTRWECGSDATGAGAPADASTSVKGIVQLATSSDTTAGLAVQANDSRLSDSRAPNGTAGGDLSGSYPNPSVAKISGTSVTVSSLASGEFLKYNGTAWVNAALSSANLSDSSSIIKSSQMPAACAQGQSLTFSSPTGSWVCLDIYGVKVQKTFLAGPTSGADATPAFRALASGDLPSISSGLSGTLPVANGGTGGTTASDGLNNLLPSQTTNSGKFLTTDGSGAVSWASATASPAGSTTQVQFNNAGSLGASANFVWDNTNSRLGIGAASPTSKLEVAGAIASVGVSSGAVTSFDFALGNTLYTSSSCGAFTLSNMQDGGQYTLIVQGTTAATCSFTHAGLTVKLPPGHGATTVSTHTIYSFIRAGTYVYVAWVPGY